jgi:hypothetical protein
LLDSHADFKTIGRASCPFYAALRIVVQALINEKLNMGNITMPEVEQATHLCIIRTTTMKHNIQTIPIFSHIPNILQTV